MRTAITPSKNLYNGGKCFTKNKTYYVNISVDTEAPLMEAITTNDLDEAHVIGNWWCNFKIIGQAQ